MPRPLGTVRILLSSRVVFNLEEADRVFATEGAAAYADFMRGRGKYAHDFDANSGGRKLAPGAMWNFVAACNAINARHAAIDPKAPPVIELAMVCKDTAETALPIFRNLDVQGLSIPVRQINAGKPIDAENLSSFGFDLFMTRNAADAQFAIDYGVAAAVINFPPGVAYARRAEDALRFCLDGDAVTFGSSAEVTYQTKGLQKYRQSEFNKFAQKIEPGPFTAFLKKLCDVNKALVAKGEPEPFKLSLLTARGDEAAARVLTITEDLGITFNDRMYFAAGASKADILRSHMPDLFLDDQQAHLTETSLFCPTGLVPYKTGGAMDLFKKKQARQQQKPDSKKNTPAAGK